MKSTKIKYITIYLIIFLLCICSSFIVFECRIKKDFIEKTHVSRMKEIDGIRVIIETQMNELQQINDSIKNELSSILIGIDNDYANKYSILKVLQVKTSEKFIIEDIIFIDNKNQQALSNTYGAMYEDGAYYLQVTVQGEVSTISLPSEIIEPNYTLKTVKLLENDSEYLLVIPSDQTSYSKIIFVMDLQELAHYFSVEENFSTVGILNNATGEVLFSVGDEIDRVLTYDKHTYIEEEKEFIYFSDTIAQNYSVFAIESFENIIKDQEAIFFDFYMIFIAFGLIILMFLIYAFKITYFPLYQLVNKLSNNNVKNKDFLNEIEDIFETESIDKQHLQDKMETYKSAIRHYMMGNLIQKEQLYDNAEEEIERIFDNRRNHAFCMIHIFRINKDDGILKEIKETLGEENVCVRIDYDENHQILLIDFMADLQMKQKIVIHMLEEVCTKYECKIAMSHFTSEHNDLARLFANVAYATEELFEKKLLLQLDAGDLYRNRKEQKYPDTDSILSELEINFEIKNFGEIKKAIYKILSIFDEKSLPEFYRRCMLTELATIFYKNMNKDGIISEQYKENYSKLLDLIRYHEYESSRQEMKEILFSLIDYFKVESPNISMNTSNINRYVQENYRDVNFSINTLAYECGVSSAYLSYVYKKSTGMNLSEYVWKVREEEMIYLLENTELNIDEISVKIGYDNVSSLRRKFKNETGKTPNQIRKEKRNQ
ncbi:MAG: AraC family transcriptional regulator [Eubacteriales bacterium]